MGARSSSSKTPGRIGGLFRDAFLRVAFRYLITDRSLAWMYDHRIRWDEPFAKLQSTPRAVDRSSRRVTSG